MTQGLKYFAGILALVFVVASGVTLTTGGLQWITAPFRGEVAANEDTVGDGDYRNATYNEYFDLCSSVQSKEDAIENLESELESGVSNDRESRINQSLSALRNTRADLIHQYNADSVKETRNFMKDENLPETLDTDDTETECSVE